MENKKNKFRRRSLCSIVVLLSLITIGICGLIVIEILKLQKRSEIECQAFYLRKKHFTNEIFNSLGNFTGDEEICFEKIEKKLEVIKNETIEKINSYTKLRAVTICTERQMRDNYFYPKFLLLEVVDFSKISWTFWKYFERRRNYADLLNNLNEIESNAYEYCKVDKDKDDQNSESGSGDDDEDEYNSYVEEHRNSRSVTNDDLFFIEA